MYHLENNLKNGSKNISLPGSQTDEFAVGFYFIRHSALRFPCLRKILSIKAFSDQALPPRRRQGGGMRKTSDRRVFAWSPPVPSAEFQWRTRKPCREEVAGISGEKEAKTKPQTREKEKTLILSSGNGRKVGEREILSHFNRKPWWNFYLCLTQPGWQGAPTPGNDEEPFSRRSRPPTPFGMQ